MSLDHSRLEKPRCRGGKLIARCPACAELGADKSCKHLSIADEGRGAYRCIVDPVGRGSEHSKRIFELVGNKSEPATLSTAPLVPSKPALKATLRIPTLRQLKVSEMATIAQSRGWCSSAGLELLTQRGLLWYGAVFDDDREWPAWVVTDITRRNAQARKLDGGIWTGIGGAKAKGLPGTKAAWPIGASQIGDRPLVLLCEGQPDFAAALLVAWWEGLAVNTVAPVCVTGAHVTLHPDSLPHIAGKRVRIAVHDDQAGREGGERWARQLYDAGATLVDGLHFGGLRLPDGQPVEDLADYARLLDDENPPTTRVLENFSVNNKSS